MAERNINVQYKLRGDTLANLEAKYAVYADQIGRASCRERV